MNTYTALKERHQAEVNAFPMGFAFSNAQFEKMMAKWGLTVNDTDKIYKLGGTGGFYLRTDAKALHEMFDRHEKERRQAIENDTDGTGYIYEMFRYELANHEYCITYDYAPTLDALGLDYAEVRGNELLWNALQKAKKDYLNNCF